MHISPVKKTCEAVKRTGIMSKKRDIDSIRGVEDRKVRHDVSRYTWWNSHEGSSTASDWTFPTRRMALLYVAKRNCEEFATYVEKSGKTWTDFFKPGTPYALHPNASFSLEKVADLTDDELDAYANGVCDAFARFKVEIGSCYRYAPHESDEMSEEKLLSILKRDKASKDEQEHAKRQALLLSDIAGFD